jgi:hypothetical protein
MCGLAFQVTTIIIVTRDANLAYMCTLNKSDQWLREAAATKPPVNQEGLYRQIACQKIKGFIAFTLVRLFPDSNKTMEIAINPFFVPNYHIGIY